MEIIHQSNHDDPFEEQIQIELIKSASSRFFEFEDITVRTRVNFSSKRQKVKKKWSVIECRLPMSKRYERR